MTLPSVNNTNHSPLLMERGQGVRLFLIDAYAIIYRSYYALIKNPRINSKGFNTSAVMGFCNTLYEVLQKEKPTHIAVAFDPKGGSFRSEIFPEYKAQREKTPEDIHASVPIIKDILKAMNIEILEVPGFEADDVIGTFATFAGSQGIDTYMLTPDKDYGQLVSGNVRMYKPKSFGGGYDILGPEEVCQKYGISGTEQVVDLLGLMGDSADNIPGCPGVGEKTAVKLITEFGNIENLLASTDKLKGALQKKVIENAEQIRLSKQLAIIRRDVPMEMDIAALEKKEINSEELKKIFEELEFRTLLKKFIGSPTPSLPLGGGGIGLPPSAGSSPLRGGKRGAFSPDFLPLFADESTADEKKRAVEDEYSAPEEPLTLSNEELRRKFLLISFAEKILSLDALAAQTPIFSEESNDIFSEKGKFLADECFIAELTKLAEDPAVAKVSTNMKQRIKDFHCLGMETKGTPIELKGELFDTTIAQYVLQPEIRPNTDFPLSKLPEVKAQLEEKLKAEPDIYSLYRDIEMPLVPVLADMELEGVTIDRKSLLDINTIFNERLAKLEEEIFELAGQGFNIQSPKQVGDILFGKLHLLEKPKKTKTGQYVTSEEVLNSLKSKHEIVEKILAYRALKKLVGTYVEALPKLVNPRTGRIHTSFNQTVTATGRLSSSDPNLQNIPIRTDDGKEIRRAFVSRVGEEFFSADYSQIELRIMAHLSGDKNMTEAFLSGHDIHAATAAKIYKKSIEEVTKEERRKAKSANFGIIYGISAWGLAEGLGIDRKEAKALIEGYFESFPQVKEFIDRQVEKVRSCGFAETMFHRRRYLPDINSGNATVRSFAERNAVNAPIQGTAADIMKIAMIRIHQRMREEHLKAKMILQVHDELNFTVPVSEKQKLQEIVIQEMQNVCQMRVPLIADYGWGGNWLEAH